jgi:hypothetical protein
LVVSEFTDLEAAKGSGLLIDGLTPVEVTGTGSKVPEDFQIFLRRIGHGALADESLCIYSAVVTPEEVFGPTWPGPALRLFADDMAGTSYAFPPDGHGVVEVAADGTVGNQVGESFAQFIRQHLAMQVR